MDSIHRGFPRIGTPARGGCISRPWTSASWASPPPWSASRKGNCIDNAATEQVFGYLKDEFYTGREFASYEEFRTGLDAYMVHWNTKRRQKQLEGHTPEEFRNMSLIA